MSWRRPYFQPSDGLGPLPLALKPQPTAWPALGLLLFFLSPKGLELDTGLRLFPKHLGIGRWRGARCPGRSSRICKHCHEWAVAVSGMQGGRIGWGHTHQAGSLGTQESEAHTVCLPPCWRMNSRHSGRSLAGILWTWLSAPKPPHMSLCEVRCWNQADTKIHLIGM